MTKIDDKFYNRADEHIALSNEQLSNAGTTEVGASMMYSVARFNAWVNAAGWNNGKEMEEAKQDIIDYFVKSYTEMLKVNLDDYIINFDYYKNQKK